MNKVEMFQADDGKLFKFRCDCLIHELKISQLKMIDSILPRVRKDLESEHSSGQGYVQHNQKSIEAFIELLQSYFDQNSKALGDRFRACRKGFVWRIVSDGDDEMLNRIGYRMMSIDLGTFREYGQPCHANNPKGVKDVALPTEP